MPDYNTETITVRRPRLTSASYRYRCNECGHRVACRIAPHNRAKTSRCNKCNSVYRVRYVDPVEASEQYQTTIEITQMSSAGTAEGDVTVVKEGADINDLLEAAQPKLEEAARLAAMEAAKEMQRPVEIHIASVPNIKPNGTRHFQYADVLEKIVAGGKVLLVGPAGTGKSTIMKHIAEDLDKVYGFIACNEGMSEAKFAGFQNVNGEYVVSDLVNAIECNGRYAKKGGVFSFDEFDALDANVAVYPNELLASGVLAVPCRPEDPIAAIGKHGLLMGAVANTFGTGADMEYSGRNQLDAATLDRFSGLTIFIDYDKAMERSIAEAYKVMPLCEVIWEIREKLNEFKIRRVLSTRAIVNSGKLHASNPTKYTYKRLLADLLISWTDAERAKVLDNIDTTFPSNTAVPPTPDDSHDDVHTSSEPIPPASAPAPSDPNALHCPICSSSMKKRVAKRGRYAGTEFWGCSSFPKCYGTRNLDGKNTSRRTRSTNYSN